MIWKMWRPFMTVKTVVCLRGVVNPSAEKLTNFAQHLPGNKSTEVVISPKLPALPSHVVDHIFDQLDVLDRCCFALCSKTLLRHAQTFEHLEYVITNPPNREQLEVFFESRLGQGWIQQGLRYCSDCGRLASTRTAYWRQISERFTRERSGRICDQWRKRREDGWLRYWIERWCDDDGWSEDAATSQVKRGDKTSLICPRCAVLNPDANAWRRRCSQLPVKYT